MLLSKVSLLQTLITLIMAKTRDVLVLLTGAAVVETVVVNILAPDLLLAKGFSRSILSFFLLNFFLYGVYSVIIYPYFLSPLRKLPGPRVSSLCPLYGLS